jgi:hypothetical protein
MGRSRSAPAALVDEPSGHRLASAGGALAAKHRRHRRADGGGHETSAACWTHPAGPVMTGPYQGRDRRRM